MFVTPRLLPSKIRKGPHDYGIIDMSVDEYRVVNAHNMWLHEVCRLPIISQNRRSIDNLILISDVFLPNFFSRFSHITSWTQKQARHIVYPAHTRLSSDDDMNSRHQKWCRAISFHLYESGFVRKMSFKHQGFSWMSCMPKGPFYVSTVSSHIVTPDSDVRLTR